MKIGDARISEPTGKKRVSNQQRMMKGEKIVSRTADTDNKRGKR